MRPTLLLVAAGLALLAATAIWSFGTPVQTRADATTTVQVGDYWFCAASFDGGVCETTINAGDTVQWQWAGQAVHSATECAGNLDTCPQPHLWDSGIKSSGSYSFTFNSPGTYVYRCQVHTGEMRGRIIVLAAATPTPTPSPTQTTASPAAGAASTPTPAGAPAGGGPPGAE